MSKEKVTAQKHRPTITIVPRRLSAIQHKINPQSDNKQDAHLNNIPDVQSTAISSTILPAKRLPPLETKHDLVDLNPNNRLSTPINVRILTPKTETSRNVKNPKQPNVWSGICSGLIIIGSVLTALTIYLPIYYLIIQPANSQSSFTNITVSGCYATTCIGQETPYRTSTITVIYPFDANTNDASGYAIGTAFGLSGPGYTGYCYVGYQALVLASLYQQYISIPYVNLSQRSFTIETWIMLYNSAASSNYGLFGQCDSNSICLSISVQNSRFVVSFNSMVTNNYTLTGSTFVSANIWFHLTVVYDAVLYQQRIYVNGRIDGISSGIVPSYQGTSTGSLTTIGRSSSLGYGTTYFQGRIDNFMISAGVVRTTCQILNDATLTAYFPFDATDPLNDRSINLYGSVSSPSITISTGRVNDALYFTSSTSYFQSQCFPNSGLDDPPYSFSLWINPSSLIGGGTIIHMSNLIYGNGSICYDLLALTNTGQLVAQWMLSNNTFDGFHGPTIPAGTWTHIAYVYSETNGVRLYVGGQLIAMSFNTPILNIKDFITILYVTLGNISPLGSSASVSCNNVAALSIASGSFIGAIDEFRIYSRELDSREICVLANP
ncbi:unnamed protein product [Adineta ricciae]|uniref:LamG domain-containing protein n=1 Tax=Adineta ricciae TaxID=249248 RepID=A0A814BA32_ADIRI|nr:unnamed protein product [Adineta ricciae]